MIFPPPPEVTGSRVAERLIGLVLVDAALVRLAVAHPSLRRFSALSDGCAKVCEMGDMQSTN